MDFFGIGPWEILLILIIALIIVGPGKIPEIARTLGRTIRAIKKASADLTTAVTREMEKTRQEPPQPKVENNTGNEKAPPATDQKETGSQDNRPTETGEAPPTK